MSEALDLDNYDEQMSPYYVTYTPHYPTIKISSDMVKKVNEMCIMNAKRKRKKERIKKFFKEFFDNLFISF
jgi:hypothetical protein